MKPDTSRTVRKKLLLLEGTLHRLEILEAKNELRRSVAHSFIGQRLPGVLNFLLQHKAGAMLTSVLPLLLGGARLSRLMRRTTLALGAGSALLSVLNRWKRDRPAAEPCAQEDATTPSEKNANEKNPGQSRD